MAQWDGKESSCACNCGFDIPKGGKLEELELTNPLGLDSGGTGVKTLDDLKALLGLNETEEEESTGITLNGLGLYWGRTTATSSLSSSNPVNMYPSFGVTFKSAPIVFATPQTKNESAGAHGIWVYVKNIATDSCTIRLSTTVTSASALGSVYANWIAIGEV